MLIKTVKNVQFKIKHVGTVIEPLSLALGSEEKCHKYHVTCENTDNGHVAKFYMFGTVESFKHRPSIFDELIYAAFAAVRSDYWYTRKEFPSINDFADHVGHDIFDEGTAAAERLYLSMTKQAEKLQQVFDEELVLSLPEQPEV